MDRADVPVESRPELAAAIDLGSNSFHLVVGRIDGGQLRIVDKLRERVCIVAGLDLDGNITGEVMERAPACENSVLATPSFHHFATLPRRAPFLGITGQLQVEQGATPLVAGRLWTPTLRRQPTRRGSRDFH